MVRCFPRCLILPACRAKARNVLWKASSTSCCARRTERHTPRTIGPWRSTKTLKASGSFAVTNSFKNLIFPSLRDSPRLVYSDRVIRWDSRQSVRPGGSFFLTTCLADAGSRGASWTRTAIPTRSRLYSWTRNHARVPTIIPAGSIWGVVYGAYLAWQIEDVVCPLRPRLNNQTTGSRSRAGESRGSPARRASPPKRSCNTWEAARSGIRSCP